MFQLKGTLKFSIKVTHFFPIVFRTDVYNSEVYEFTGTTSRLNLQVHVHGHGHVRLTIVRTQRM